MNGVIITDESHFAEAINKLTEQLNDEFIGVTKDETKKTAEKVNAVIYQHAPELTGDYKSHFAVSTAYEDSTNIRMKWHVKAPEYRLTHLLEYGHAIRKVKNGPAVGQARAIRHIGYGFDERDKLHDNIMSRLNNV